MSPPDPIAPQIPGSGLTTSFRTGRTVIALILREMSTRYGRSPGGYLWAILEPLGAIIVMALAFSLLLRTPALGNSFILFYATGFVPFTLYQSISSTVARSLSFSKPLMHYPAVTWCDAVLARFILNALTGIFVGYIVLTLIMVVINTHVQLDIVPLFKAIALALLMGLAVGVLNCMLSGMFSTWDLIWSIISRPLFLASGVIFIYEDMPPFVQKILWYNPLMHITGLMREGFYPTYNPIYISELYVIAVGLVILFLGVVLLRRYNRVILYR